MYPIPLAFDNAVATAAHGSALPFADAALTATVSAVLAFAGLSLGARLASGAARNRDARQLTRS
jgi:hypothetical protein